MARPKQAAPVKAAATDTAAQKCVAIEILADGVFIASGDERAKGDKTTVPADIADALVKSGHAKRD